LIQLGPKLLVQVGFDPGYDPRSPGRVARLPEHPIVALVDTGASISCIDIHLAKSLELPEVDAITAVTADGPTHAVAYLAQVHSPSLKFTLHGRCAGLRIAALTHPHVMLIGRDFLSHFRLLYDGPSGNVELVDPEAPLPHDPTWDG
jgi:predicted aspartyl protease